MLMPFRGSASYIFLFVLTVHLTSLLLRLNLAPKPSVDQQKDTAFKVRLMKENEFKKQIVQSEDSENKKVSDDAFLSDKNRSFERQTKAKKVDTFKQARKGGAPSGKPKADVKLSDLAAFAPGTDPFKEAAKDYTKRKSGMKTSDIQAEEDVSSTNDHVEEVPLGDLTHLNTAEYKYYGFYHRIRQRLEQFWGASLQDTAKDLAKSGRQLSMDDEHVTSLQITLDHVGKIVSIRILGSSGVQELDNAAIESFNDAGPFPNPPKGMIKNGIVTLEWGFVVQT